MKYVFIVNRTSGKTDYDLLETKIKDYMKGKNFEIIETKRPLHATEIASKYKDDKDTVVYACGGDGTLNEVINGIAGGKCKLGLIPTGSGNDFYKSLKLYNKKESTIDLGLINGRYFINISSIGIDADICDKANEIKLEGKNKKNAYVKALLGTLFKFKSIDLELEIDNKIYKGKYMLLAVCNGRYYGNGFKIAPLASFDDDHFDVYLAHHMNKFRLVYTLSKLLKGTHETSKKIRKFRAHNIIIKAKEKLCVNIDGEIIKSKLIKVQMIPNAIHLFNDKDIITKVLS